MKRKSNLLLYLLLNILVSAATTLVVLWAWDAYRGSREADLQQALAQSTVPAAELKTPVVSGAEPAVTEPSLPTLPVETAGPTETLPPASQPVIQIVSVVGAGDIEQEVVMLKRAGAGNVSMVGWKLRGEHNNTYTFPAQPELILFKDGAVQIYTRAGTDTVTEVYWNRSKAAWNSGELIRLLDPQGTERATYRVP